MKLPCPTCHTIMSELKPIWNPTFSANLYLACGNTICPSAYLIPTSNYIKINENVKSEKYGFVFIDREDPKRRWKLEGDVLIGKTELLDLSRSDSFNAPNINSMTSTTAAGYNIINTNANPTTNGGLQIPFMPPIILNKPIVSIPFVELALETDKFVDSINYLFNRLKNMIVFS